MLEGGFVIDGRLVTLADVRLPDAVLHRRGRRDRPPRHRAGHPPGGAPRAGLRAAHAAPATSGWWSARRRSRSPGRPWPGGSATSRTRARCPSGIEPMHDGGELGRAGAAPAVRARARHRRRDERRALAGQRGRVASSTRWWTWPGPASSSCRGWSGCSVPVGTPPCRWACCSTEQARRRPNETFFLFEDRAHTWGDAATPHRQRRPRAAARRGPPGRARGRADGHTAVRAGAGRGAVAARGGRRGHAARRSAGTRGRARAGRPHRGRPRARRGGQGAPRTCRCCVLGGGGETARARVRADRHGAHRPGRGAAAGVVPAQPGPGRGPRVRAVHGRRRAHPGQPHHQPPVGAVRLRHRLGGRPVRCRHGVLGHADPPPVRPADLHRWGGGRRGAAGPGDLLRPDDLLERGAPVRRDDRLVHVDPVP